ncbi:hypothetical protein GobsT_12090 [Gemmata obscuriglobus]|uniref:Uncharacterized protein n=2 Tax=Gemmata TaxID=113 RepID=A0A2Z3H601_9BACT|nr:MULTISPECIES: hypothetical protein [Gemmata]AWM40321.1 hypothetical protein C1280_27165 [Gemmata obscuriglobus]MDY3558598.1 hypothetical protein [Gemmata algarum]QEG26469.1 hypothetical protein GobsT_12090 [Gemmata obscuriglobus]VTS01695.1 Uncharacterized protein OS=Singulisphaera acidiphila (strain ATCC BAA-1392 / DSM 18658 / VKM B-2454 / MOB10) GN=Sinac_7248 PE=4 SV=1 [Gemmata obscuriglobus UQM 2246]
MALVLIPAVFVLLAWANTAAVRALRARRAPGGWWAALAVLWLAGAAAGAWGGFFAKYQASPTLRVYGLPLPIGAAILVGPPGREQWVGYASPAGVLLAAANVPLVALLAGSAVGPVFWLRHRSRFRTAGGHGGHSG